MALSVPPAGSATIQRLDPKCDIVFKLLLTREPALLLDMLQGILGKPIGSLEILNLGIPGELPADKEIELDVRVALDDGSRADVEMQIRLTSALRSRLMYYATRDYSDQLGRGDGYEKLTSTAVIVWSVQPLFSEIDRLHCTFEMLETHTHVPFGAQLAIHVMQLSALRPSPAPDEDARVHRWARFLTASSDAELNQLASEDPIMNLAKQTLDALSQDPATHRLVREREEAIKLYRIDIVTSKAEGLLEGKAELLLKLLGIRFGSLPETARARITTASSEQLDAWAERMMTASTLDEVLAL